MVTILLGTDWKANTDAILKRIAKDVAEEKENRILIVPELVSHDMERRLCAFAGDTASRFAEVLSFTRLARRVAEFTRIAPMECLDNGGRVVAMAAAARQMHSKLKAYASLETRPEFLTGLVEAVDEFKRCCVTASDLKSASQQTDGNLAQKLEELSLLLEAYDSLCARGRRDPRDQMAWLLEQLEDSSFAEEHTFYFNGFPDFSRQNMAIVSHLIADSPSVVISMICDEPGSTKMAFEKAGETTAEILKIAKKYEVPVCIEHISPCSNPLNGLHDTLLQGKIRPYDCNDAVCVLRCETVYEECVAAADRIIGLIQSGCRYRDIRVVCTDMEIYQHPVNMVFKRAGIPVYQSGTEEILEKTVIHTVLCALDAALSGFEQKAVIRYLKSMLSPLSPEICDRVENYAILWSVDGKRWTMEWENHPDGLSDDWSDYARQELQKLNQARALTLDPLIELHTQFREAANLAQMVKALYQFLIRINLAPRLQTLAKEMDASGNNRSAQILNQLWEILINALEQLYDMLGNTVWDPETFTRLFKLLLSQYDVGTIPSVLDAVTVGSVSAMRCHQGDHLILLGAVEGSFPHYGGSSGVLTDMERLELQKLDIHLNSGAIDGLQKEFSEIFDVFRGTIKTILVSCPAGQPSFIYDRLKAMVGERVLAQPALGPVLTDKKEAGAYLVRTGSAADAERLGLSDVFADVVGSTMHQLGEIKQENVKALYGDKLHLSASQIDRLAECRMSYFMKYGMRAKERKAARIDPAEFGTYVHAVLEQCGRKIVALGGFKQVTLEKTLQLAADASARYFAEHFIQLDSERLAFHFQRNSQEVMLIVEELWKEMQQTKFQAADFEVGFGTYETMNAVSISGKTMEAELGGYVDRVDTWQSAGKNYFRIVDYKTGAKDFDYCDVFNGIGLQMLLYLYALEDEGASILGCDPIPAGVQYFPARVPLISADGILSDEEAESARVRSWRRKGLLLQEEEVLYAMEPSDKPQRLPYTTKKDGTMVGDLASRKQFKLLRRYLFGLLSDMVDEIASGHVDANPYTRGSSHNACAFCPYGPVCHPETITGRRDYKAMKADKFWEAVEKEVNCRG